MKVVALQVGFYDGQRRRVGDVFDMVVPQKEGKPKMPKWVKQVTNVAEAKAEAEQAKKAAEQKQIAGVKAASGGKAAAAKVATAGQDLAG